MADQTDSNFLEFEAAFRELMDGFSFQIPGKDQSLGRDLAGIAAQGIVDRSVTEQAGPNFQGWRANDPKYTARKQKEFGVDLIGVRTGQMLSLESVMGQTTVGDDEVEMKYGTNTPASRSSTGMGKLKADEPTDTQKAGWFTDGGREFYELGDVDAEAIYDAATKALEDYLTGA